MDLYNNGVDNIKFGVIFFPFQKGNELKYFSPTPFLKIKIFDNPIQLLKTDLTQQVKFNRVGFDESMNWLHMPLKLLTIDLTWQVELNRVDFS